MCPLSERDVCWLDGATWSPEKKGGTHGHEAKPTVRGTPSRARSSGLTAEGWPLAWGRGGARPSSHLSLSPGYAPHLSGLCPEDQVRPGCGLPARGASLRIRGPPLHGGLQALATSSEEPVGGLGHCVMCTPLSPGTEGHLGWGPLTWLVQGEGLCVPVATQSLLRPPQPLRMCLLSGHKNRS